jgi:uncharacterized protein YuzE
LKIIKNRIKIDKRYMIKYTTADLDYIFIRSGSRDISLNDLTDNEFIDWAKGRFGIELVDSIEVANTPWTPQQKVDFINEMSTRMGQPAVSMIRRERRDEWEDKTKEKFTYEKSTN